MSPNSARERAGRRPRVGLLIAGGTYAYQVDITWGAHEQCAKLGLDLICLAGGTLGGSDPRSHAYSLCSQESLDAAILVPGTWGAPLDSPPVQSQINRLSGIPRCVIGVRDPHLSCLWVDNETGVYDVTRHLIEAHGRRRVAFVSGNGNEAVERRRGYERALSDANLAPRPELLFQGDYQPHSGQRAVEQWTAEGKLACDAIVAANDWMAVGALEALLARGLNVPEDVSLVGFDDIERAAFLSPSLTTVRQLPRELGSRAVGVIARLLSGGTEHVDESVPTELCIRRSCGCYGNAAAVETAPPRSQGVEPHRSDWTAAAVESARSVFARPPSGLDPSWPERLVQALEADLANADSESFLSELQAQIFASRHEGNVGIWYHVVGRLRDACLRALDESREALLRVEALFARGLVTVGDQAERIQGERLIEREDVILRLQDAATDARTALDLSGLGQVLQTHLPRLGVPSCHVVSAIDGSDDRQLVLACADGRLLDLPAGGVACPDDRVLPEGWAPEAQHDLVVYPLFMREAILGHCCLQIGPRSGAVFQSLADILSGSLESIRLSRALIEEATERERAERARMSHELAIATRIQTAVLPVRPQVAGLEIATRMIPASEVGGDYVDVLPHSGGAWIGIGDVTGHGLTAGLTMLMIQGIVAATVYERDSLAPEQAWRTMNAVLSNNIRRRLKTKDHATLTLIQYHESGRMRFAGSHEDLVIHRAATGLCETVETPGLWAGLSEQVDEAINVGAECQLMAGDLLLLYTDGALEARNRDGEMFEIERLKALLQKHSAQPVEAICSALVEALTEWTHEQTDDLTFLVARQR